jgi:cobalt/nickel transport system permease protein
MTSSEMHIPDGFLDTKTVVATGALAAAGLGTALYQVHRNFPRRKIPLLGLGAAFVFAAQMINFPIPGGTSGHLIGSVLIAVLLGPSAAVVVMSSVLIVQSLLFADGGITTLGANIFNMGIVGAVGGYWIFRAVRGIVGGSRGTVMGAAFAAWCATVLAAVFCAGELAASQRAPWALVFPAMTWVHMVIGIGEALITSLVIVAIGRTRPELLEPQGGQTRAPAYGSFIIYGALLCAAVALFLAPFACPWPDGLDKVARTLGFEQAASAAAIPSPLPDYHFPGIASAPLATSLAGLAGTLLVFILTFLLARWLVPKAGPEIS